MSRTAMHYHGLLYAVLPSKRTEVLNTNRSCLLFVWHTMFDYMKRWGFDALTYQHRKQLLSASGLKDALHPTVLYNVLCAVYYESIK